MRHRVKCLTGPRRASNDTGFWHHIGLGSRGSISVLSHSRVEAKRLQALSEFGHPLCNCLDVFRKLVTALQYNSKRKSKLPITYVQTFCANLSGYPAEEVSVPKIGRLYRKWRKRHWNSIERLGRQRGKYYATWGLNKTRFAYRLAEELSSRGHYVTDQLNGAVLNVSLGSLLTAIRVEILLNGRSRTGREKYNISVLANGLNGKVVCLFEAQHNVEKSHFAADQEDFLLKRAADLLERGVFAAYLKEKGLEWDADISESESKGVMCTRLSPARTEPLPAEITPLSR